MIKVDCSELDGKTKLALAEAISEGLGGKAVALLEGDYIAIDSLSGQDVDVERVKSAVGSYLSQRRDASAFTVGTEDRHLVVQSSVPVSKEEKRVKDELPPGFFQCPVCGFVANSKDEYNSHLRYFHFGLAHT